MVDWKARACRLIKHHEKQPTKTNLPILSQHEISEIVESESLVYFHLVLLSCIKYTPNNSASLILHWFQWFEDWSIHYRVKGVQRVARTMNHPVWSKGTKIRHKIPMGFLNSKRYVTLLMPLFLQLWRFFQCFIVASYLSSIRQSYIIYAKVSLYWFMPCYYV